MKESSTIKLSNDIPIPDAKGGRPAGGRKYPFDTIAVGQSFPITPQEKMSIYSCVKSYNKRHNGTIKIRTGRDKEGVLRCWRVE